MWEVPLTKNSKMFTPCAVPFWSLNSGTGSLRRAVKTEGPRHSLTLKRPDDTGRDALPAGIAESGRSAAGALLSLTATGLMCLRRGIRTASLISPGRSVSDSSPGIYQGSSVRERDAAH